MTAIALDGTVTAEMERATFAKIHGYMGEFVASKRRMPTDDLRGQLLQQHGSEVSDAEVASIGHLLLLAGHETTANTLGISVLLLTRHSQQFHAGAVAAARIARADRISIEYRAWNPEYPATVERVYFRYAMRFCWGGMRVPENPGM